MNANKRENPNFFEIQKSFNDYWKGKNVRDPQVTKGKGWKPFKRWEWFMRTRVNKNGYLDVTALWKGYEEKKIKFSAKSRQQAVNSSNWVNLGPQTSIPSNGGGAGRINCITFHPTNSNIIYVGSPSGGLWKTTDGGSTWSSNTDELPDGIGITSLIIDPTNTNIMYIGTGDGDAGDTYSVGVLKSTDGGTTWNTTGLSWTLNQANRISKIIMHPTNTNTLISATRAGIYKTTDGGTTWTNKLSGNIKDIEIDPSNSSTWYAGRYGSNLAYIYKSTDTGETWTQLTSGLPASGIYRVAIAIAPSSPSTIYALFCNNTNYGFYGIYKSTNSGSTWTIMSTSPNLLGWSTNGSDQGGQGWYDLVIAVSPTDANTVYAGGVNIWKSTNSGSTWTLNAHWYGGGGKPYVHADHHAFEFIPGTSNLISGNDGGFFKTTNGGTTWTDLSNGLGIHQYYRIGASAINVNIVYGGSQDNGTDRYNAGTFTQVLGGDGMECLVDYTNSNIAYGELYYGDLFKTTSGGNLLDIPEPDENGDGFSDGDWVTPYVIHPSNPSILYYAATKVHKTTNGGSSWSSISPSLGAFGSELTSLAVASSDPNYIYTANSSNIWKTTNGGGNWINLTGVPSNMTYITVSPYDQNTVWVTIGGYTSGSKVYKTTNGGTSWTNVSGNLPNIPANCVAVHPDSPNDVYIGTDLGAFLSTTGGDNWQAFDNGLPNVIVNELEIHKSSNKIRAGTYGRGLWESPAHIPSASINLTSPNGGEIWLVNSIQNIKWNWVTTIQNVKIEYSTNSGTNWITIINNAPNTGSYTWTVTNTPTTTAKIRISALPDTTINDISNGNFVISTSSLALTSPNGGENWSAVTKQDIIWNTIGSISNVKIEYSTDSGINWINIITNLQNSGKYSWTIPNNQTTSAKIKISNASNSAIYDISDSDFTISQPVINITTNDTTVASGTKDFKVPIVVNDLTEKNVLSFAFALTFDTSVVKAKGVANTGSIASSWDTPRVTISSDGKIIVSANGTTPLSGGGNLIYVQFDIVGKSGSSTKLNFSIFKFNDGTNVIANYVNPLATINVSGTVGISTKQNIIPKEFTLNQNYPNPFNPVTKIEYGIPEKGFVKLIIYDILGREIKVLVNEVQQAGIYNIDFNASEHSNGIYIYKLIVNNSTKSTKKMVLLK
jgi:photosystem II stability/assembly factor-like uncharacterized protein